MSATTRNSSLSNFQCLLYSDVLGTSSNPSGKQSVKQKLGETLTAYLSLCMQSLGPFGLLVSQQESTLVRCCPNHLLNFFLNMEIKVELYRIAVAHPGFL